MAPSPALPPPPPSAFGPAARAEHPAESTGADLFKRLIWIPAPAALGYVAVSAVNGGVGAVSIYVVIAALLCVPAQVLAFLWASHAWRRLLDWRLASASVLAAASVACLASVSRPTVEAIRPYRIGLQPNDVVYTPEAMWVSDSGDGTVYRVANDGSSIRPIRLAGAFEVVADGSGVWVSHPGAVTKLLPDGSVGMTVAVPALPGDMVVAGDSLWMTLPDAGLIARVHRPDGTVDTYRLGGRPASIASAKGLIWVTDIESNRLFEVDASTGRIMREIQTGTSPLGVYSDGATIWVANSGSNSVTAVDASGDGVRQFRVPASPTDLVVHEGVLWVVSERGHTLSAIDIRTAEVKRTVDLGGGPLKLEIHPPYVVVTNPGLGLIQNVPLAQSAAPPSTAP